MPVGRGDHLEPLEVRREQVGQRRSCEEQASAARLPHQTGSLARWCECQRVSARFASSDRQSGSLVRVPTSFGEVRLIRQAVWLVGASANEFRRGSPHQTGSLARWCECQRVSARFASSDRQSGSLVRAPTSFGEVASSDGRLGCVRARRTEWSGAWRCVVDARRVRGRAARGERGWCGAAWRGDGRVVVAAGGAARAGAVIADGGVRPPCRAFRAADRGVRQESSVVVVRCRGPVAASCRARRDAPRAVVARGEKRARA